MLVKHDIFLERETLEELRKRAKKQSISVSEVVRRFVKEILAENRKSKSEAKNLH